MTTAPPGWLADAGTGPEAVIREARRRQHRRWLAAGLALALAVAGVAAVIAGSGAGSRPRPPGHHAGPSAPAHAVRPALPPGLVLAGAATTVVMWPVGYPLFTPTGGPPAYVADLGSGHLVKRQIPGIIGCDCRPYLIDSGGRLVYVGSGGITAISANLTGRPRVLGSTQFFAPSAVPGQVWLVVRYRESAHGYAPVRVRPVPVTGGPAGPAVTLPAGAGLLLRGTDAGFLLEVRHGRGLGLVLWHPGGLPRNLPYAPAGAPTAGIDDGFDATARLVAYGTGCRWQITAANAPQDANVGYLACAMLRVLDVVTGRLVSFPAPPGTAGWVPGGFDTTSSAISPAGQMIAAYAAMRPPGEGRVRLYLMRLTGPRHGPAAVPSSVAIGSASTASTAWTAKGSWLLYQGPGGHLWAYQATSGTVRASSMRHYGMVALPNDPG